jgi:aspartyl-tRNA(Asn)/glutamyl-tRNA(Gln) amidotransferase subunit A
VSELARASASELLAGFEARAFSPVEALDAIARRIESVEPALHAFATLTLDRARAEAEAATQRWQEGTARPLEGVPFAAKDLFDTGGVRTAYGSPIFAGHVPAADAAAVRLLREAGAILVGKTTTHEFAWGVTGCNRHFGTGRNPWSLAHVAGGSSAGSAAALAADEVPLALGSDTGGSIRIPAAFCGVSGLKPTHGLVDTTGVFPLAPSLDHAGPLARTPHDLRIALAVLARSTAQAARRDVRGLRVGVCATPAAVEPTASVRRAVADAADVLAALGCRIVEVVVESDDSGRRAFAVLQAAEAIRVHRGAGLWPERRGEYGDDVAGRLEDAESITLDDQVAATIERERLRARFERLFDTVDLLLLPVSSCPPVEWGREDLDHLGERRLVRDLVLPLTSPLNLAGVPGCAVRGGFDDGGLPVGLQVVGPRGSEATVLAAASVFFDATPDLQQRRPKL